MALLHGGGFGYAYGRPVENLRYGRGRSVFYYIFCKKSPIGPFNYIEP